MAYVPSLSQAAAQHLSHNVRMAIKLIEPTSDKLFKNERASRWERYQD